MLRSRRWIWVPFLVFMITRLGIAGVAYFATPILADSSVPPYHLRPDNTLVDVFASRWDSGFYLEIAERGYGYREMQFPSVAFFPLMPVLMRLVHWITGDFLSAGLWVANLCLLAAVMLLHRFTGEEYDQPTADRTVWFVLIFPTSFFGSAIYSESLFLLLSVATLYLARKGHWWAAGMMSMLAAMTRFVGIILAAVLLVEWLAQRSLLKGTSPPDPDHRPISSRNPPGWESLVAVLLAPLGTLAYMGYLARQFGDALAFFHASDAWGRTPATLLVTLADMFTRPPQGWLRSLGDGALPLDNWMDLAFVIFFLVLGVVLLAQRRWSDGAFVTLGVLIPFSSGLLMSQRRYVWVLFPAFILLARWGKNSWMERIIFMVFLLLLGLFTALFANWYWVG